MDSNLNLTSWQKAAKKRIDPLLLRDDFLAEVEAIRRIQRDPTSSYGFSLHESATIKCILLMGKYRIQMSAILVVMNYVANDQIDYSLTQPPAQVLSDETRTIQPGLKPPHEEWKHYQETKNERQAVLTLLIDADATKAEVIEFIDKNWKNLIVPLLGKHGRERTRIRGKKAGIAERDAEILRLAKQGLNATKIADQLTTIEHGYSSDDIRAILFRLENAKHNI